MKVSFGECAREQWPALMRFFARVYRPDYVFCRSQALGDWQYGGGPAGPGAGYRMKLALLDGEIGGCLGYIPVEVSLGGGRVARGAWAANWIVDPAHQRRALGPLLMRELMQQQEVTLTLGLSAQAYDFLPRLGWTNVGDLVRHVAVLDAQAAARLCDGGRLDWPVSAQRAGAGRGGAAVSAVRRFGESATALWDARSASLGAGTRRSAAYLNWRYAEHPSFSYRAFEAQRDGRLTGVGVYRVEAVRDVPVSVGRIVEFFAEEADENALFAALFEDARAHGVAVLDFFCSSPSLAPTLGRHGFLSDPHPALAQIPVLFQPIVRGRSAIAFMAFTGNLPESHRPQRWYVTKSDGDQDRPN